MKSHQTRRDEGMVSSPSVRRAWIDIPPIARARSMCASPSVRRAWIEIRRPAAGTAMWAVALREEGVD